VEAGAMGDDVDFLDGACCNHRLERFFIHYVSLGKGRFVAEW
jgi:hypothetical protein